MPWNPETYLQFKNIRFQPFFDLAENIQSEDLKLAIDLGCGTGEQTFILAERFPEAEFLGIDSSKEMLEKSKEFTRKNLHFKQASVQDFIASGEKYDLIFSNAALQWSQNHKELFPALLRLLNPNGQFAVQIPLQTQNRVNLILLEVAKEEPFTSYLKGFTRESSVLTMDDYTNFLFEAGLKNLNVYQKVYPVIAKSSETLYEFISGSTLIPYMERLNENQQEEFSKILKERIEVYFPKFPAIYVFKRLLLYGRKN